MSIAYDIYRVLLDHCTESEEEQRTFVCAFSKLLERTTFKRGLSADDLWMRLWDKPFFANVKAAMANPSVEHARPVFEQLGLIRSATWKIEGPVSGSDSDYKISGTDLEKALHGNFAGLDGEALKFPCTGQRLYRNRRLALAMDDIAKQHQKIDAWLSADAAASSTLFGKRTVSEDHRLRNAFRTHAAPVVDAIDEVPGFARTTAFHGLADVGYPVYKTDMWVRAFVLAQPDVGQPLTDIWKCEFKDLPADLLNPETKYGREFLFDRLDTLLDDFDENLDELGELGTLSSGFQRLRAADFLFAHFGISAQKGYGIHRTPFDVLKKDASVATQYPELSRIASTIELFGQLDEILDEGENSGKKGKRSTRKVSVKGRTPLLRDVLKELE